MKKGQAIGLPFLFLFLFLLLLLFLFLFLLLLLLLLLLSDFRLTSFCLLPSAHSQANGLAS